MHGIPLFAPLLHFSFAGEDTAQSANGALVGAMVFVGGFAAVPCLFAVVLLNQKIRVTLLEAGPGEGMRRQKVGQPANSSTSAKAALHASMPNGCEQIADWRMVFL